LGEGDLWFQTPWSLNPVKRLTLRDKTAGRFINAY
jgi:hypothetical protein